MDQQDKEFLAELTGVVGRKLEDIEGHILASVELLERLDSRLDRIVDLLEART